MGCMFRQQIDRFGSDRTKAVRRKMPGDSILNPLDMLTPRQALPSPILLGPHGFIRDFLEGNADEDRSGDSLF